MIVKIYNLGRVTNRLIGYIKVNEHDFTKVLKGEKISSEPNERFYRKFHKDIGLHWSPNFAWKELSPNEVTEIIESYKRKITFFDRQKNVLSTLITL